MEVDGGPEARTFESRVGVRDFGLLTRLKGLHTAVIADALDQAGLRHNVMDPAIRPLDREMTLVGYAVTVEAQPVDGPPEREADYYKGELAAVDSLDAGDVLVVSTCRGPFWGELLATASRARGANGIVADAYTRDSARLISMGFATFVAGISAQDSLGRVDVVSTGGQIQCGGVRVAPGDLLIANCDGVAVIPASHAASVVERAEAKLTREEEMRGALREGMPVRNAFSTYGVL
jgi:4-hydroxy-4-methyl-2-oxoglutarate aldolase